MKWVKIPEHEDYEINEMGEVRFLGKTVVHKNGSVHQYPPRLCNPMRTKMGYYVSCDGQRISVAFTVAKLFVPNPRESKRVYHIDGNMANNCASNIAWGAKQRVLLRGGGLISERDWLMENYDVTVDGRVIRKVDGIELATVNGPKGYRYIRLKAPAFSKNKDMRKGYKVHRLVAMYYLDDYSEDLQVNHKNGNKQDNRVENLEMVTNAQNVWHAWNVLDSSKRKDKLRARINKDTRRFISNEQLANIEK